MALMKAKLVPGYFHHEAELPHGLTVEDVRSSMQDTCDLLSAMNEFLVGQGHQRLEDIVLGNSFSGILSEFLVKGLSAHSRELTRNLQVGGHPDLILRGTYPDDKILRAEEGVEVKVSRQRGGWQGHNPEDVWLLVFRYKKVDEALQRGLPVEEREPMTFIEVLGAQLRKQDWSFSGRSGESRRTITASIARAGMARLRANPIYRDPAYAVRQR